MDGTLVNIAIVPPHWLMQSSCMYFQPNVLPFSHSFVFLNSHFCTIPHLLYWTHAHEAITLHMHILIVIRAIQRWMLSMKELTFQKHQQPKCYITSIPAKQLKDKFWHQHSMKWFSTTEYISECKETNKQKQKQLAATNPKYISIIILNMFN